MNILYILGGYFPSQLGGPNNTIHWQAKYLAQNGINVTVASISVGLTKNDIEKYSIKLNAVNQVEGVNAYYYDYLKYESLTPKLYWWLIRNLKKFDFVQLTSYFYPMTWVSALLCRLYDVPFSIAPRGELEENALKYSGRIKRLVNSIFLKTLYKRASFVLTTSDQELKFCERYFSNMKFELIPNYIDLEGIQRLQPQKIMNKKDILYLGRIHPKKGIENLIKAYISLDEEIKKQHYLLIVGDGDMQYKRELKKLVLASGYKDKIKFLGHQQGERKKQLYRESKVFVLPSYSENFGNVVLEALSFSTPVIASKHTPWRGLEDNKCGFWVNNTPEKIKESLVCILKMNDSEYRSFSINSYNFVYKHFSMSHNVGHLKGVYQKYVKK
jgi:glycosyltransferase involved in cell wall biosynthesis